MNTTKLIELLRKVEFGASGRPREISFVSDDFHYTDPVIEIDSTGDGIAGAELTLKLIV